MWNEFIKQFITLKGYENVLNGLWITVQIAVGGLLIGILIGTIIAVVRVMPKYAFIQPFSFADHSFCVWNLSVRKRRAGGNSGQPALVLSGQYRSRGILCER